MAMIAKIAGSLIEYPRRAFTKNMIASHRSLITCKAFQCRGSVVA